MKGYDGVTLETLNSGAVTDLFEDAWQKLLGNIQDPNTRPDAVRKVKIEIAVKPAKDRRNASTSVSVTQTLAPVMPHEASIVIGIEDGTVRAFTFDPKQQALGLEDEDEKVRPFPKEAK
jgi:hypothetical protein